MDIFFSGRLVFTRIFLISSGLCLLAIGIASIYAVGNPAQFSQTSDAQQFSLLWKKQLLFAVTGLIAFFLINLVNYRKLGQVSYLLYAIILVMLAVVLLGKFVPLPFVPLINGTHRWIRIGKLPAIQPSEFCKLIYIIALAWYLRYKSNYRSFKALIGPFLLTLLPMVLILLEPDLGTVLLMMPILFTMLFVAGAKVKHLLLVILLALAVSPVLWMGMNQYQRVRISAVLLQNEKVQDLAEKQQWIGKVLVGKPFSKKQWETDWGYHLIRSKYALASGGLNGYGYRKGPFIKYKFLAERHNDFIFATICHQWGLKGALVVIALYTLLIGSALEIASQNTDPFAKLLAVGIVTMFAVEVIVNTSMTVGLMPITGLTLPLVSYGGSSLLISLAALGLLNNIGRCRAFSVAPKSFEKDDNTLSLLNSV
jgi:cell division protein FtsW (lipid II flippase)